MSSHWNERMLSSGPIRRSREFAIVEPDGNEARGFLRPEPNLLNRNQGSSFMCVRVLAAQACEKQATKSAPERIAFSMAFCHRWPGLI